VDKQSAVTTVLVVFFEIYRTIMLAFAGLAILYGHVAFTGLFAGMATIAKLSARFVRQSPDRQPAA
jgi:hypothetical protein